MSRSWRASTGQHVDELSHYAACALLALVFHNASSGAAHAGQLGALLSPGPLAKAHAALEGATTCRQCHEVGRRVTAARCLACHQPVADRIASRKGVHRSVTECVSCHTDHAGRDSDLRRLDTRTFNHTLEAGYVLDGLHTKVACAGCHKNRSFLDARTACVSCHVDVHKPSLGADCTRCHSTQVTFKRSRDTFDHTTARFKLTGAHSQVACAKCHKTSSFRETELFRGKEVGACTACHVDPHRKKFDATCTSCHNTERWDTRSINHARTRFPLLGAHGQVACAKCHQDSAMIKPVRFEQCAACHVNVHRESIKEDCGACHTENTFKGAAFDHGVRTTFSLEGKHQGLACVKCHTTVSDARVPLAKMVVDYRGAENTCVACHLKVDPHKGELGRACDACHSASTFSVKGFAHPRAPDFYRGQHETVRCEKCHLPDPASRPPRAKAPSMECSSCHRDVHLGQVAKTCELCHTVEAVKFAASKFNHESSRFRLTGKHTTTNCVECHRPETRAFPSGMGTSVAYTPIAMECRACHKDPHFGQVDTRCETCHATTSFAIESYKHQGMTDFFRGFHSKYACKDCHKAETAHFPAGQGTAVRFIVGRTCASCHRAF